MNSPVPDGTQFELPAQVARGEGLPADQVEPATRFVERDPGGVEDKSIWIVDRNLPLPARDVPGPDGSEIAAHSIIHLRGERKSPRVPDSEPRLLANLPHECVPDELLRLHYPARHAPVRILPRTSLLDHEQVVTVPDDGSDDLDVLGGHRGVTQAARSAAPNMRLT